MAKDPAFLFYPGDWLGGTLGMTHEQKGAYMELLMLQFNRGHMTLDMIRQTLGHNHAQLWVTLSDKFVVDDNGLYYNTRLQEEKVKRQSYTESRFNNKKGTNQHSKKDGHMSNHMEDENVNEDINEDKLINKEKELKFYEIKKIYICSPYESLTDEAKKKCSKELYNCYCDFIKLFDNHFNEIKFKAFPKIGLFKQKLFSKFTWAEIEHGVTTMLAYGIKENMHILSKIIVCIGWNSKTKTATVKKVAHEPIDTDVDTREYWEIHYSHLAKTKEEFMKLVEQGIIQD